jgi:AhpC/TSA family
MKLEPGLTVPALLVHTIHGKLVTVPDVGARYVHLQFRRFAGCPVCNFHLHTLNRRRADIAAAGIHEVVFFHSSRDEMLKYQAQLPFDCVADPDKLIFRQWGVEASWFAPLHPAVLWNGLRGLLVTRRLYKRAENGIFGLPADFLVDAQGRLLAANYGAHADDHWDVDELLQLAAQFTASTAPKIAPLLPATSVPPSLA